MSQAVIYPDWRAKIEYGKEGPRPQTLQETEKVRVILGGLEAGAYVPPHSEAYAMYHFLEGSGWMVVGDERLRIEAGATVFVPNGVTRGIEAETRLAWLAARIA
jgi:quercetin dioxygenase-like cupin family protein